LRTKTLVSTTLPSPRVVLCWYVPFVFAEDEEDEEPLVLLAGHLLGGPWMIAPRTPLTSRFVGRLALLSLSLLDPIDWLLLHSEEESLPSDSSLSNVDCCC
jgi:hypothetical protein